MGKLFFVQQKPSTLLESSFLPAETVTDMCRNHFLKTNLIFAIVKTNFLASGNHFFPPPQIFFKKFFIPASQNKFYTPEEKVLFFTQNCLILEGDVDNTEDCDLKKRAKYTRSCKDSVWSRQTKKYLRHLKEQQNLVHNSSELKLKKGDVVIIRGDKKNMAHWKTGIVDQLLPGRGVSTVVWYGGLYPTPKSHLNLKRKISLNTHFNTKFYIEKRHPARHNFSVPSPLNYHIYFYRILVLF